VSMYRGSGRHIISATGSVNIVSRQQSTNNVSRQPGKASRGFLTRTDAVTLCYFMFTIEHSAKYHRMLRNLLSATESWISGISSVIRCSVSRKKRFSFENEIQLVELLSCTNAFSLFFQKQQHQSGL